MSNTHITYLVGAGCAVIGAGRRSSRWWSRRRFRAYRRVWERLAVVVLSGYVLAALVGVGVVLGARDHRRVADWFF